MSHDVRFAGLKAPFRVNDAAHVLELLPDIVTGWPFDIERADPSHDPFFSISAVKDSNRVLGESHVRDKVSRKLDPLNALCDMAASLPYALADADDRLICLHAAGIRIGGRLIVFPNVRRAGKSTLSAALAMAGHDVFSDDVLPTSFDTDGHAFGHALGIAPRLRMPLPEVICPDFRHWVDEIPGPENKQYKYLTLTDQPAHGQTHRIGAFVMLDRQDSPCAAELSPVSADEALKALLHQNFTRDRHSADILESIAASLLVEPSLKLTYFHLHDAIACLESAFEGDGGAKAAGAQGEVRHFRLVGSEPKPPKKLPADRQVMRRDGTFEQMIGDTLYLADPDGLAIHRMDPLAAAIWDVLEEPAPISELEQILIAAFPNVSSEQITVDLDKLLRGLARAGLIRSGEKS